MGFNKQKNEYNAMKSQEKNQRQKNPLSYHFQCKILVKFPSMEISIKLYSFSIELCSKDFF